MTKTTLILPEQPEPNLEFPLLAKHDTGAICQFRNKTTARMLIDHDGTQAVDNLADWHKWTVITDDSAWTILPRGTKIVIEQL